MVASPSGNKVKRRTSEQVLVIVGRAKLVRKQRFGCNYKKKAMLALQVYLALDRACPNDKCSCPSG